MTTKLVAAGNSAGMGVKALNPVLDSMEKPNPVNCKTITFRMVN